MLEPVQRFDLSLTVQNTDEIINTVAIAHSDQLDPDPTNNRSSLVINQDLDNHPFSADLAIFKTVNQNQKNVGDRITLTLVIRNNGPDDAAAVEIKEVLPEGFNLHIFKGIPGNL